MANTIQIKRALVTLTPGTTLEEGELAFTFANKKLWLGAIASEPPSAAIELLDVDTPIGNYLTVDSVIDGGTF